MVPVLQKLDADPGAIRERTHAAIDGLPTVGGDAEPEIRPSQAFIRTLQRAEQEMAALGDEYISTEHLLLGLADKSSGLADLLPDSGSWPRGSPRSAARTGSPRRPRRTRCRRSRSTGET